MNAFLFFSLLFFGSKFSAADLARCFFTVDADQAQLNALSLVIAAHDKKIAKGDRSPGALNVALQHASALIRL